MSESTKMRQPQIDFDQWSNLAASDPQAFEARRNQLLDEAIRRAPAHRQQRLRCLQWRVDRIRECSGTPLAACIRMSEMMWDKLIGEGGLRDTLGDLSTGRGTRSRRSATVVKLESGRPRIS